MDKIEIYLDFVLLNIDPNNMFRINNILLTHIDFIPEPTSEEGKKIFFSTASNIKELGYKKYKYFEPKTKDLTWFKITDKGREAIEIGGHFKYLETIISTKNTNQQRQKLSDQKLIDDAEISRHAAKRLSLTFIFFIIGVGYALFDISLKILEQRGEQDKLLQLQAKVDTLSSEIHTSKRLLDSLQSTSTTYGIVDATKAHQYQKKDTTINDKQPLSGQNNE